MDEMKLRPQAAEETRETREREHPAATRPPTPADMLREVRKPENDFLRRFRS